MNNTIAEEENKELLAEIASLKSKERLISYSQAGEDRLINFIIYFFTNIDQNNIHYIDIGANHPTKENNTYFFYQKNGKGILIEPNKELCEIAQAQRPRDIIINAGIKFDEKDSATYYSFNCNALNTFDKNRMEFTLAHGHTLIEEFEIPLLNINQIIEDNLPNVPIDLISIDVEGVDFQILKTIDFKKHRPKILCIEANKPSFEFGVKDEIITFMENLDYVLMGDTTINYVFLEKAQLK